MNYEPAFGHAPPGRVRYWTRARIDAGLGDFLAMHPRGMLPSQDDAYSRLKKGNPSWPTAASVLKVYGSMSRAWLALGAQPSRVSLYNVDWTDEEDEFLLENAGRMTLRTIAKRLHRSYGSVRMRLNRTHGKRARDVQCFSSAAQVAAMFGISYSRVQHFCRTGQLKAKKHLGNWRIDPRDAKANRALLAPKRTYRTTPPDVGDYYQRYGIRRRRLPSGKLERYEAAG